MWSIAFHEILQNLRSRGYLMATFGAPLFVLVLFIFFGVQKSIAPASTRELKLGFLDLSNSVQYPQMFEGSPKEVVGSSSSLFSWISMAQLKWTQVKNADEAQRLLLEKSLDGVYVIQPELEVRLWTTEDRLHLVSQMQVSKLWLYSRWLEEGLKPNQLQNFDGYDGPTIYWFDSKGVGHESDDARYLLSENEKASFVHIGVYILAIMLMSGYLISGLSDEKEQKTLEFLLSLVSPLRLLSGKLLGIVLSGLLQVITWGVTFVFPAFFFFWSMKHSLANWTLPFLFFIFGYVFYGGALLSLACSASSPRESRQASASWLLLNAIPIAFYSSIMAHPNHGLTRVLSFLPITSPITMIFRLGIRQTSTWEIALSLLILAISTVLVLVLASRRVSKNTLRNI